jgi:DNA-binding phage protein
MTTLRESIRQRIDRLNPNMSDLARRAGLSRAGLYQWLKSERPETAERIGAALDAMERAAKSKTPR